MNRHKFIAILVLFFYLLTSEVILLDAADVIRCSEVEVEALLDFRVGLIAPGNRLSSWKGKNCCQWHGIGCDKYTGAVTSVDLHNPYPLSYDGKPAGGNSFWNLSGEIRPSLLKLKYLTYFDLSYNTFLDIEIPDFIGYIANLRYLNLSTAGFGGQIPPSIGNISRLQYLDVSKNYGLTVKNLDWLTKLSYLKHLNMNDVYLSTVSSDWLKLLSNLTSLTVLQLSNCGLSNISSAYFPSLTDIDLSGNNFNSMFPYWLLNLTRVSFLNLDACGFYGRIPLKLAELPNLLYVSFAMNYNLTASCTQLFSGSWPKIEFLDLGSNKLHGKLPVAIGNMTSLMYLSLFDNNVEGGIPSSIGKLCNLSFLEVSGNNMTGTLPAFLEGVETCLPKIPLPYLQTIRMTNNKLVGRLPEWIGQLESLEELSLDYNNLDGQIPDSLGKLQRLTSIGLARNNLNGTLPETFGQLSELAYLDVSFNHLTGTISEAHFLKLRKLTHLHLSSNSLTLYLGYNWIPPFQVIFLDLGSCKVGPSFPNWLKTQKNINLLDLSNASISDSIPNWFWDLSFNLSLLNFSTNQMQGQLPSLFDVVPFADIDFSSNQLEGPIPLPSVEVELYSISFNKFSGVIPYNIGKIMPNLIFLSLASNRLSGEIPSSIGEMILLEVVDFSHNLLTGRIPSSLANCLYLKAIDLGYNNFSGVIPYSFGNLQLLQSLHLNNNNISGNLPSSFRNLSSLETMDLADNRFEGVIPPWLGNHLKTLKILSLRSNSFSGGIPRNFSLFSNLQVLDLALNKLTGIIPTNLGNLTAMSQKHIVNQYRFYGFYRGIYYRERLVVNLEGEHLEYTKTLSMVAYVDLSGNRLSGHFPAEITDLIGLVLLNLSRNEIDGQLPDTISKLVQLGSLDLSGNSFSGVIPSGLSSLTFLSRLNLSNNNFSGRIPRGGQLTTFGKSSFAGNPKLCGPPLLVDCNGNNSNKPHDILNEEDDGDKWLPLCIGMGFATGILGLWLIMSIRSPWSEAYFGFVEHVVNMIQRAKLRPSQVIVTDGEPSALSLSL